MPTFPTINHINLFLQHIGYTTKKIASLHIKRDSIFLSLMRLTFRIIFLNGLWFLSIVLSGTLQIGPDIFSNKQIHFKIHFKHFFYNILASYAVLTQNVFFVNSKWFIWTWGWLSFAKHQLNWGKMSALNIFLSSFTS